MSATQPLAASPSKPTPSKPSPITFGSALRVEAHKLLDTRANQAVIAGLLALSTCFGIGYAAIAKTQPPASGVLGAAVGPGNWLLMVLSILLISSEFTRRTAVHTFTLDPKRPRVLSAKALVLLGAAVLVLVLGLAISLLAVWIAPLFGAPRALLDFDASGLAIVLGSLCFTAMTGLAWGLLARNAAAPLVFLLLWPTVSHILGNVSQQAAEVLGWINIEPVWTMDSSPRSWAMLATSALVWVVLPGALGTVRLMRADL